MLSLSALLLIGSALGQLLLPETIEVCTYITSGGIHDKKSTMLVHTVSHYTQFHVVFLHYT